jgi:diacylglycerol kinase
MKNEKNKARTFLDSQSFAFNGIKLIIRNERNFRLQMIFAILVFIAGIVLDISHEDWVAVGLLVAIVLITEAYNSVIEALCDTISKEYRVNIKYAKDVSAGCVLISAILSAVAGTIIFAPYVIDKIEEIAEKMV